MAKNNEAKRKVSAYSYVLFFFYYMTMPKGLTYPWQCSPSDSLVISYVQISHTILHYPFFTCCHAISCYLRLVATWNEIAGFAFYTIDSLAVWNSLATLETTMLLEIPNIVLFSNLLWIHLFGSLHIALCCQYVRGGFASCHLSFFQDHFLFMPSLFIPIKALKYLGVNSSFSVFFTYLATNYFVGVPHFAPLSSYSFVDLKLHLLLGNCTFISVHLRG